MSPPALICRESPRPVSGRDISPVPPCLPDVAGTTAAPPNTKSGLCGLIYSGLVRERIATTDITRTNTSVRPKPSPTPHRAAVVDVLVPVALDQAYSYRAPAALDLKPGDLVCVPLGNREATGVVWADD